MSRQSLSLNREWDEVKKEFKRHFKDEDIKYDERSIKYSKSNERLIISKNGYVKGEMPLHQVDFNASKIVFKQSHVKLFSESSEYIFRR